MDDKEGVSYRRHAGNECFKAKQYDDAERHYTTGLEEDVISTEEVLPSLPAPWLCLACYSYIHTLALTASRSARQSLEHLLANGCA